MKVRILLPTLLFSTSFLLAQNAGIVSKAPLSLYGTIRFVDADFTNLNAQLARYQIPEREQGTAALNFGIQQRLGNTKLSNALELNLTVDCSDHRGNDSDQSSTISGAGLKLQQSYALIEKNRWVVYPSWGIGYERLKLKVKGLEADPTHKGQFTTFNETYINNNVFVDLSIGAEKEINHKGLFLGVKMGHRMAFEKATPRKSEDAPRLNFSNLNPGGFLMEVVIRKRLH